MKYKSKSKSKSSSSKRRSSSSPKWGEKIARGVRMAEGKTPVRIRVKKGGWGERLARHIQQGQIAYAAVKPHVDEAYQRWKENRIREDARRELLEQQRRMYYAPRMQALQQQGMIKMVPPGPNMWDRFQKWRQGAPKPPAGVAPAPPPTPQARAAAERWEDRKRRLHRFFGAKPTLKEALGEVKLRHVEPPKERGIRTAYEELRKAAAPAAPKLPPKAPTLGPKPIAGSLPFGPPPRLPPRSMAQTLNMPLHEDEKQKWAKYVLGAKHGAPVSPEMKNLIDADALKRLEKTPDMDRLDRLAEKLAKKAAERLDVGHMNAELKRVSDKVHDGLMALLHIYHETEKVAYGNVQILVVWANPLLTKFAFEPPSSRKTVSASPSAIREDVANVQKVLHSIEVEFDGEEVKMREKLEKITGSTSRPSSSIMKAIPRIVEGEKKEEEKKKVSFGAIPSPPPKSILKSPPPPRVETTSDVV